MKLSRKIRKFLHDLYYTSASKKRVAFALTCKEVTEITNVGEAKSHHEKIRFLLHLSLCQLCKNYYDFSKELKKRSRLASHQSPSEEQIQALNKKMLKFFKKD